MALVNLPILLLSSLLIADPSGKTAAEPVVFFPGQPPFGIVTHTNFNGPEIKSLGITWIRNGISWRDVEPKIKGQYDFSGYDKQVAHYLANGMNLLTLLPLEGVSELYPQPKDNLEVVINGYAQYARACAKHYKGKVKIWELGNEPECFTMGDVYNKPENYVKIARAAAKAIRQVDSQVHVAALSVGWIDRPFILRCLELGLLEDETIDVITFHGYHRENIMAEGKLLEDVIWLREQIARYAPRGKNIIVVDSERGYALQPFLQPKAWDSWKNEVYSETEQAAYLARHFLAEMAAGVEVSIWYKDMSGESGFSLYEGGPGSRLRPMGYVLRNMASLFNTNPKQMINRDYHISLVDLKDDISDPNCFLKIESFLKEGKDRHKTLLIAIWNPVEAFDGKILHSRQRIEDRYYEAWRAISPQDKVNIPLQVNIHGLKTGIKTSAWFYDLLAADPEKAGHALSLKPIKDGMVTDIVKVGPIPTIIRIEINP